VTLVLGNQVQIWLARCFTSGDVFDFINLTTFQPKFFRDLWTFIVGTGLTKNYTGPHNWRRLAHLRSDKCGQLSLVLYRKASPPVKGGIIAVFS